MWTYPENNLINTENVNTISEYHQYFHVFLKLTDHKYSEYKLFFPVQVAYIVIIVAPGVN